jgi:hypothetical protein
MPIRFPVACLSFARGVEPPSEFCSMTDVKFLIMWSCDVYAVAWYGF